MKIDPWLIVTPQQYKEGWIEMRGDIPVYHAYIWVRDMSPDQIVVRNPQWLVKQRPLEMPPRPRPTVVKED